MILSQKKQNKLIKRCVRRNKKQFFQTDFDSERLLFDKQNCFWRVTLGRRNIKACHSGNVFHPRGFQTLLADHMANSFSHDKTTMVTVLGHESKLIIKFKRVRSMRQSALLDKISTILKIYTCTQKV